MEIHRSAAIILDETHKNRLLSARENLTLYDRSQYVYKNKENVDKMPVGSHVFMAS